MLICIIVIIIISSSSSIVSIHYIIYYSPQHHFVAMRLDRPSASPNLEAARGRNSEFGDMVFEDAVFDDNIIGTIINL